MDEAALSDLITSLLVGSGPTGVVLVAVLTVAVSWWRSVSGHLCLAVPRVLAVAEKFADDGVQIKLTLNLVEDQEDPAGEQDAR